MSPDLSPAIEKHPELVQLIRTWSTLPDVMRAGIPGVEASVASTSNHVSDMVPAAYRLCHQVGYTVRMPNSDKTVAFELTTTHKQYGLFGDDKTLLREDVTKRYFRKSANAYRAQKRANGVNYEVFMISDYAGPLEDAV